MPRSAFVSSTGNGVCQQRSNICPRRGGAGPAAEGATGSPVLGRRPRRWLLPATHAPPAEVAAMGEGALPTPVGSSLSPPPSLAPWGQGAARPASRGPQPRLNSCSRSCLLPVSPSARGYRRAQGVWPSRGRESRPLTALGCPRCPAHPGTSTYPPDPAALTGAALRSQHGKQACRPQGPSST